MPGRFLRLGCIGADPRLHRELLDSLQSMPRILLSSLFDPCLADAAAQAQQLAVSASPSLESMFRQVDGAIFLDAKWMGAAPLAHAARLRIPVLVLESALDQFTHEDSGNAGRWGSDSGSLFMPELAHRWAASTLRVKELVATRLGPIESIAVEYVPQPPPAQTLAAAIDWCCDIAQSEASAVPSSESTVRQLHFRRLTTSGLPASAQLWAGDSREHDRFPISRALIACRQGTIEVAGEHQLHWRCGGEEAAESLTGDRSARTVMLDLFGRRLAGGLVPVPDLGDWQRALSLCGISGSNAD